MDTVLDRVVFGEPVTPFDLYQRNQLHEASRRRNGECGLDVIVCSKLKNTLTADMAAEMLVKLAKEHFPQSDLANSTWTAPAVNVKLEIKNRKVDARTTVRSDVPSKSSSLCCRNRRSFA